MSQFYDPANAGNPPKITLIQEKLQTLQKSPQAWLIANSLLSDNGTDLRFFGALTFTIKINQDWCVVALTVGSRGPRFMELLTIFAGNS